MMPAVAVAAEAGTARRRRGLHRRHRQGGLVLSRHVRLLPCLHHARLLLSRGLGGVAVYRWPIVGLGAREPQQQHRQQRRDALDQQVDLPHRRVARGALERLQQLELPLMQRRA